MPPKTHLLWHWLSITHGCLILLCWSLGFSIWRHPCPAGVGHGHSEQGKVLLAPALPPPEFPELAKGCPGPSSNHHAEPQCCSPADNSQGRLRCDPAWVPCSAEPRGPALLNPLEGLQGLSTSQNLFFPLPLLGAQVMQSRSAVLSEKGQHRKTGVA